MFDFDSKEKYKIFANSVSYVKMQTKKYYSLYTLVMKNSCKAYYYPLMLVVSLFMMTACSSEESENNPPVSSDYITVAPDSEVYFESESQNDTLLVRSNVEWRVLGDNEWCQTVVLLGSECDTLVICVTNNGDTEDRTVVMDLIAGSASEQVVVRQYGSLQTNYIDMKLENPKVRTSYNSLTGDVSVVYTGNVPPVKASKGQTIILPAEYNYAIRVVESSVINGTTVNLQTSKGNMCNLFRNVSFTLTTDPTSVATLRRANKGRVVTPIEYGYYDSQGQYHKKWSKAPTQKGIVVSEEKEFWSFEKDFSGEELWEQDGELRLWWEKYKCNSSLQATMTFEFGLGKVEINDIAEIGEAESFGCNLSGDLNMDMILKSEFEKEFQKDRDEIFVEDVIPVKVLIFKVGCVPVAVMLHTDLGAYADVEANARILTSCGMNVNLKTQVGIQWTKELGVGADSKDFEATVTSYPITVDGKASLKGAVSLYTRLRLYLYESLGPRFDIAPYVQGDFEGFMHYSSDKRAWLGWKSQTGLGVKTRMAVDWKFLWWDGDWWDTGWKDYKTWSLLSAPDAIKSLNSGLPRLKLGDEAELVFQVTSYDKMGEKTNVPCPNALVFFKGEYLSSEYAVSDDDGLVKVKFKPEVGGSYGISARMVNSGESPDGFFNYSSDALHEIYVYTEEKEEDDGGVGFLPGIGGIK